MGMPLRARDFRASNLVFKRDRPSLPMTCQFACCCCTHVEVALLSIHKMSLLNSGSSTQAKCTGSKCLGIVPVFLQLASANLHWPCQAGLVPMMGIEQRVTSDAA